MVAGLDGVHDPTAARDAALILIGYTAALRRSELAALSLADVTEHPDGAWIEVFIATSKTDQHRQGHHSHSGRRRPGLPCRRVGPVATLAHRGRRRPLGLGRATGPSCAAFRPIRKGAPAESAGEAHGAGESDRTADLSVAARRLRTRALTDRSIAEIIKRRAGDAGLPGTWSGHSPRRGFATQAYTAGVEELEIMRHGRWRSQATMRSYIAEADRHRAESPITALGLGAPTTGSPRPASASPRPDGATPGTGDRLP